jgi:protein-disulfide isomerase
MSTFMNRGTAIVGFVLSFVTGAGFMYAVEKKGASGDAALSPDKPGSAAVWHQDSKVPIASDDPALGPKNAPVTVVVFSDYQCPFCSRVEPTLKQLRDQYGDKIRVVWKDLPLDFHKNALPAATAAYVAFLAKGNDAFWKVHEKMFQNQQQLSDDSYLKWLAEVGVDKAMFEKHRAAAEAKVKSSLELSKQLGIQGTPNFMIDGEALTGALPIDKFKAVIDAHLRKASELKSKGTSDDNLYAAMVNAHYKQAAPEPKEEQPPPEDTSVWNVALGHSPVKGPRDAKVTVVTFSDFQCPFCKRVEPALAQLEKEYAGKVRFVWKNQPLSFHNRAMPTAIAAWEAYKQKGSDGFWKMHDALFESQPKLEDADIEAAAKKVGLDVAKVMDAVKTTKWKDEIQKDVDQAEELKVQGTPHSFVNGRVVNGAVPYEQFKKVVDEEIAKADAKIKSGVAADKVYEETIKGGKGGAPTPLAIPAHAPVLGKKDANVVVHVFSDYQCPFCKRAEVPMPGQDGKIDLTHPERGAGLMAARDKYKDQIAVVWHDFPLGFHNRARPAANFAKEAKAQKGNDTYWKIHDELFASQPKLEDADFEAIAKKHGLDWAKCKSAIDTDKYKAEIEQDMKDGAAIGVTGTPAFVIQSGSKVKQLVGAQPAEAFFKTIDSLK